MRVPRVQRKKFAGRALVQTVGQPPRGKAESRKGRKTSRRCRVTMAVSRGMGEGERKQKELDGAGGVCARAALATVNAHPVGKLMKSSQRHLALTNTSVWSLPALTSDRHALRHVADC
eukprot:4895377-Pleurochrysis_carterae.AAC.1